MVKFLYIGSQFWYHVSLMMTCRVVITFASDVKVAAAKKRPSGEMAAMWLCKPAASTDASCCPEKLNRRISFLAEQENSTPELPDL